MRPEIDLQVMQEIGAITLANDPAIQPLGNELRALLEALQKAVPKG